jgi:hypothetical protein
VQAAGNIGGERIWLFRLENEHVKTGRAMVEELVEGDSWVERPARYTTYDGSGPFSAALGRGHDLPSCSEWGFSGPWIE